MSKFEEIIQKKKQKSASRKPRYGTRKLSIGLVSCVLGYAMLVSPSVALADEAIDEPAVVTEETNQEQETEEAPVVKEDAAKAEKKEVPTEVKEEDLAVDEKEATPVEEVTETEAPVIEEEKEAQTADIEKESDDKLVEDKEDTDKTAEEDKKESLENKDSIEISPEDNKENDRVSAEEHKDISNDIINPRVSIRTVNTATPGTLNAGNGEQLTWGVSFTTPEGTKAGDTFSVKLSDNMSLKGLEPDTDYALPVKFGDKIIATAKRIDRQTIQYTFTKDIEDLKYARVYIINSAQENKDVVQNSGNQTFKINVGEKAKAEKDIDVDFGKLYHAETSENVNGKSQFTEFNPETGEFTQVFYLNPESKVINTSSTNDQNGREFGKVGFILASPHDADKPRSIDYLENNTKIEVKKLPKGAKLPDAVIENPKGAQLATNAHGGFRDFKGEPMFTMDFGGGNKIDSPYVVVVKGHANKIDGKYTNLYSIGTLYGDRDASLFLDNSYTVQDNNTDAEGVKETLGYFKEHHIYITKENGKETSRFEIPGATVSGTADEYYYTDKNDIPGYHFVKIGEGNNAPKNDPDYDAQGKITKGNFEVGKTKEVTYIYERDIVVAKKGSFQEHHIYQTKKLDGTIVKDDEVNKDETSGTEKENYKTSKIDRKGYKLIEVKSTNGGQFNKDGSEKEAAYIADQKQEVTYIYQKEEIGQTPLEETGKFQEHHVYRTLDKDGKVIKEEKVDGDVTGGTSKMTYTTGKIDKEGFEYKRTETPVEGPTFNEDGSKATGNYKPGVTQEITYVYEKTQTEWTPIEETGKFQEHHIYITKDEDGKEIKREIVDGKITGGTKEMTYTTGRKEKDGFKFVRTENPVEDPSYNDNGDSKEGNFKPGVKQEITYVYEKTVKSEKPSKPTTPTTPSKPEEPTVPSTPEEPTVPSTPEEPTVPSTPEEPEKTTPLISFTPADPIDKAREVIEREENNRNVVNENKVPGHKNSDNPKTGIASSLGAMGTLAASALAFIGLDDKKRKNK